MQTQFTGERGAAQYVGARKVAVDFAGGLISSEPGH